MTIKELIKYLKKYPKDAEVKIKVDKWSVKKESIIDSTFEDIDYIVETKMIDDNAVSVDLRVIISED